MKRISYIILLLIFSLTACEDVIQLNLPEGKQRLVVDGLVSDANEVQTVKLFYSASYFNSNSPTAVSNAEVVIKDDLGNEYTLTEASPGIYQNGFVAEARRSYSLYVRTTDGKEYQTAPQVLEPVAQIDSIYTEFIEKGAMSDVEGYMVSIDVTDTPKEDNYYRWRLFVNGEPRQAPQNLIFGSDQYADGLSGLKVTFYNEKLQVGDHAVVEQMSISKEAYEFLALLRQQTAEVSGQFDTPPAPIIGNVKSKNTDEPNPLGFFQVSAIERKAIVITEHEQQ